MAGNARVPRVVRPTSDLVLPDTHVWEAFRKRDREVRLELERLTELDAVAFLPPVWFEFARGVTGPAPKVDHELSRYADFPVVSRWKSAAGRAANRGGRPCGWRGRRTRRRGPPAGNTASN